MARAWLGDDVPGRGRSALPSPGGWKAVLDDECDDSLEWGTGADADGRVGPVLGQALWALSRVEIRGRTLSGFDENGNVEWLWPVLFRGESIEQVESRVEVDDVAGSTTVRTQVRILYGLGLPPIAETATLVDAAGTVWRIVHAMRASDSYLLTIEQATTNMVDLAGIDGGVGGSSDTLAWPLMVDGGNAGSAGAGLVDGGVA